MSSSAARVKGVQRKPLVPGALPGYTRNQSSPRAQAIAQAAQIQAQSRKNPSYNFVPNYFPDTPPETESDEQDLEAAKLQGLSTEASSTFGSPGNILKLPPNTEPQWNHLPLEKPERIKLNIAINKFEARVDVVSYGLQEIDSHAMPWMQDTTVLLELARKGAVATIRNGVQREKKHVLLLGKRLVDAALAYKDRYESFVVLEGWQWPTWYPALSEIWGGGATEGVVTVKNAFDGTYRDQTIRDTKDLELCRLTSILEIALQHFKTRSGLSTQEVQDIFSNRTDIRLIVPDADVATQESKLDLYREWMDSLSLSEERVQVVHATELSGSWLGSQVLKAQFLLASQRSVSLENLYWGIRCGGMILEVDYHAAKISVVEGFVGMDRCDFPTVKETICKSHGCNAIRDDVKAFLQQKHGWKITAAAFESNTTCGEILDHMVENFHCSLLTYNEDVEKGHLRLQFPTGVHWTRQKGHDIVPKTNVKLRRWDLMAIAMNRMAPLVVMVKDQIDAIHAKSNEQQIPVLLPHILLTGYWTRIPCLVTAFMIAMHNEGVDVMRITVDGNTASSNFGTKGALWLMTVGPNGSWEI